MFHVFILIRSLDLGGAQRQGSVLSEALHRQNYKVTIGVFYSGGILEHQLREKGISIYPLDKKGRWDLVGWFYRYLKALRDTKPDIVYSFLTTANIVGVVGKLFHKIPIVWGIRTSYMNLDQYDWLARFTAWIEKRLSLYSERIIFNSERGRQYHQERGYRLNHKAVVIPNGINTDVFKPNQSAGKKVRHQLNIPEDAIVVGMLARYDPMKDYETFLKTARSLCKKYDSLYFIAAGNGTDTAPWVDLPPRLIRLGDYENSPDLLNAFNMMVLCSFGEGFPNVVGEAMACGLPVIATNVGDCAIIIEKQGRIIPVQDSEALIQAIEAFMVNAPAPEAIRQRIISHFSVDKMVESTLRVLKSASS